MLRKGFTLIELLIVLSIMVIVFLLVIPSHSLFLTRSQDQVLSSELMRAIALTRNEAITKGMPVTLCGSLDAKNCVDEWRQGYIIFSSEKVLQVFLTHVADGLLNWRAFPNNRTSLQFLPSGVPNAQNGTFWYCRHGAKNPSWAIAISQSGRARLMYPNEEGFIEDSTVSCD